MGAWRETSGKNSTFLSSQGDLVPGSIAEINYISLGRVDQWVMLRGESVNNPPLIQDERKLVLWICFGIKITNRMNSIF
jgi:hypothetical protein